MCMASVHWWITELRNRTGIRLGRIWRCQLLWSITLVVHKCSFSLCPTFSFPSCSDPHRCTEPDFRSYSSLLLPLQNMTRTAIIKVFSRPLILISFSFLLISSRKYNCLHTFTLSKWSASNGINLVLRVRPLLVTTSRPHQHAPDLIQGRRKVCNVTMGLATQVLMISSDFVDVKASDFRIFCGGRVFEVHQIVLEEYPYFQTMLSRPWKVSPSKATPVKNAC